MMLCQKCKCEVREGNRFCGACGFDTESSNDTSLFPNKKNLKGEQNLMEGVSSNPKPISFGSKVLGLIGLVLLGISTPFAVYKTITDPTYENYKLPVYVSLGVLSTLVLVEIMKRNKTAKVAGMAVGVSGLLLLFAVLGIAAVCLFFGALSTAPAWVVPVFLLYLWTRPKPKP